MQAVEIRSYSRSRLKEKSLPFSDTMLFHNSLDSQIVCKRAVLKIPCNESIITTALLSRSWGGGVLTPRGDGWWPGSMAGIPPIASEAPPVSLRGSIVY